MQDNLPTDLSKRLRNWDINSVATIAASDLHAAAEEIERYYAGMLNWKATAEAKDAIIADLRNELAEEKAMSENWRDVMRQANKAVAGTLAPLERKNLELQRVYEEPGNQIKRLDTALARAAAVVKTS